MLTISSAGQHNHFFLLRYLEKHTNITVVQNIPWSIESFVDHQQYTEVKQQTTSYELPSPCCQLHPLRSSVALSCWLGSSSQSRLHTHRRSMASYTSTLPLLSTKGDKSNITQHKYCWMIVYT